MTERERILFMLVVHYPNLPIVFHIFKFSHLVLSVKYEAHHNTDSVTISWCLRDQNNWLKAMIIGPAFCCLPSSLFSQEAAQAARHTVTPDWGLNLKHGKHGNPLINAGAVFVPTGSISILWAWCTFQFGPNNNQLLPAPPVLSQALSDSFFRNQSPHVV